MNDESTAALHERIATMRADFDAVFARPMPPAPPALAAILLLWAGVELVAVRRADMMGLARAENIAPTPPGAAGFLGLVGLHGALHPVWQLSALLGNGGATAGDLARGWLVTVLVPPGLPCAFWCDGFESLVLPNEAELAAPAGGKAVVRWNDKLVPLIDLVALGASVRERQQNSPSKTSP